MQPDLKQRGALVLGGTGTVGSAVLRILAQREVPTTFTYLSQADKARALADEYGQRAHAIDLGDPAELEVFLRDLPEVPAAVIHCAAISGSNAITDIDDDTWQRTLAVNASSAFAIARHLARRAEGGCDLVLVGALDRAQSLPLPVHYAASQGMLSAMAMALAHELGPRGFRVNMIALGVMEGGLSASLALESRRDYERFSALRRVGTADEAAKAICWLALDNNYINGKIVPVNGGI